MRNAGMLFNSAGRRALASRPTSLQNVPADFSGPAHAARGYQSENFGAMPSFSIFV
jgi:hypothetical protein